MIVTISYDVGTMSDYHFGFAGYSPMNVPVPYVQPGWIVVIFWAMSGQGTGTPNPPNVSCSGFTSKADAIAGSNMGASGLLWKRATSAEYGNYSVSFNNTGGAGAGEAVAISFDGCVSSGDPFDSYSTAGTTSAASAGGANYYVPSVSVTTTVPNTLIVWNSCSGDSWANATPPTGFTELVDSQNLSIAVMDQASAATVTASNGYRGSSNRTQSVVMGALKPWTPPSTFFSMF